MRHRSIGWSALWLAIAPLAIAPTAIARAHDPGMSIATFSARPGAGTFELIAADVDLPPQRRATSAHCAAHDVIALWLDGRPLTLRGRCRVAEAEHTAFEGSFTLERSGQLDLDLRLLSELPRGHASFVRWLDAAGKVQAERMLSQRGRQPLVSITDATSPLSVVLVRALPVIAVLAMLVSTARRWRRW